MRDLADRTTLHKGPYLPIDVSISLRTYCNHIAVLISKQKWIYDPTQLKTVPHCKSFFEAASPFHQSFLNPCKFVPE